MNMSVASKHEFTSKLRDSSAAVLQRVRRDMGRILALEGILVKV